MQLRFLLPILSLIVAMSGALPAAYGQSIALPEIGQSGGAGVTPSEERRTGEAVMRNFYRMGAILDDPLLHDYINLLGYSLIPASNSSKRDFQFFMVDDDSINAFALPGGYIGVNYGLLLATESESEVASVLAHEIAHVTQRHHARAYEFASQNNIPVLAALIAAIVLGTQNGELAQAALATVTAGSIQQQINFTRENEKEADYIGIQLLADSGYNPQSMAAFFSQLSKESRLYGPQAPEFLRTHPVNESRIADASNRAAQLTAKKSYRSQKNYFLMRARVQVLTSEDKKKLVTQLSGKLKNGQYQDREATLYAIALGLMESGQYQQARTKLDALLKQDPERIAYLLARAKLESLAKRHQAAISAFKKALADYPHNGPLTFAYSQALLNAGKPAMARKVLLAQLRKQDDNPNLYRLLAEAESSLGNTAGTHVAMGEYYYRVGLTHQALDQLNLARKTEHLDWYNIERIEARLADFKEELTQLEQLPK